MTEGIASQDDLTQVAEVSWSTFALPFSPWVLCPWLGQLAPCEAAPECIILQLAFCLIMVVVSCSRNNIRVGPVLPAASGHLCKRQGA